MAHNTDVLNSLQTCIICYHDFDMSEKAPRIIHTDETSSKKHMACTACLKKMYQTMKRLECPMCRKSIEVNGSIENLPVYEDDVTHLKQIVTSALKVDCSSCGDPAVSRCENCHVYLCEICQKAHKKNRSFRNHNVRALSSLTEDEKANFDEIILCPEEDHGLALDMYCKRCETPCCLKCEEHLDHGYTKLRDVVELKGTAIKEKGTRALEKRTQIQSDIAILKERKESVLQRQKQSRDDITTSVSSIITNVKMHEEQLLQRLVNGNKQLLEWFAVEIKKRSGVLEIMGKVEVYFNEKRQIGDRKKLELYQNIERGLKMLDDISPQVRVDSEEGGCSFVPYKERIQDFQHFDIGRINISHTTDDDQLSNRGRTNSESTDTELRVLAIGKKRSGRTKTLNALMTQDVFISGRLISRPGIGLWKRDFKGRSFLLSKTPGFDSILGRDIVAENQDIRQVADHGPHALLLTIRNPDEDVTILNEYRKIFEGDLFQFLIVVFTGKKDLDKVGMPIDAYVRSRGHGDLSNVLAGANNRYIAVNPDDKESHPKFREKLFKMILDVGSANGYRYLTLQPISRCSSSQMHV
ncbi:transcription intermediary factor 1-beta-like [Haliotis rubra]|uniref:transcription intermediary factor 1-beta-like n=1 Tax=Haliotis rubra TaxID=36100 RepID=UPI001EE62B38|nr:transcription intermediary factor 1-beta-like [Haliotis rubra]